VQTIDHGGAPRGGRRSGRAAFTLVEVLFAAVLLAVLAIGGGALVYRSRADIVVQQYKRAAIDSANARMEMLMRGWITNQVAALVGAPAIENSPPLTLNNVTRSYFRRTTTVANGPDSCWAISVSVQYGPGASDVVTLDTLRSR
jgi:type II secretory pathway pseudopilin PulG